MLHEFLTGGTGGVTALALSLLPACTPARPLAGEHCHNGIDDDLDGLVDCRDPDCARAPSCGRSRPHEPELPGWIGAGGAPDLGASFEARCEPDPSFDREVYALGCALEADDCGDGLRCVPLTRGGEAVETGCVRRGCAAPLEACDLVDGAGRRSFADACGLDTLCVDLQPACAGGHCCVPLCSLGDGDCGDCRPLSWIYGPWMAEVEGLEGLGVCADPGPHDADGPPSGA